MHSILQSCVDEIRKLTGGLTHAKPGQHILINANTNAHQFEINQECVVTSWDSFNEEEDGDIGVEAMLSSGGDHWFVRHTDYILKETKTL